MQLIPIELIDVRKRQRRTIDPVAKLELKNSILSLSLLHPPVVIRTEGRYSLLVGERRFRAIEDIAKDKKSFRCGELIVEPGQVPVTLLGDFLSEAEQFAAELEENVHRVDLTWQEKVAALAELHELRLLERPKQTYIETGKEVVAKPDGSTSGSSLAAAQRVKQAVVLSKRMSDPAISNARNATEAYNILLRKEQQAVEAALARKSILASNVVPDIRILSGDLHEVLPTLSEGLVDLVLADPPYGINATGPGFRARTAIHHNYEDSPEEARRIALTIMREGFRIAKQRANLLLFTDIAHWDWLQRQSASLGWTPFRRPLIWGKSPSEGMAPWGAAGPRITTEFIFYATKGQRGMTASPTDYIPESRVPRNEREHGAQKPVALLRYLIECTTLPGDFVLDPCCGSGSTLVAARDAKRTGLGIELNPSDADGALARLYQQPEEVA